MTDSERAFALHHLIEGRDALLSAIAGLSEAQFRFKPAPGRWSIAECVEHVATTEEALLPLVSQGRENPDATPLSPEKDGRMAAAVIDRSRKVSAPDSVKPARRFASVSEATAHFLANRERSIAYTRESAEDLRRRFTIHPVLGEIDCYRCLLLLALHPARHAGQIAEIRRDPAFSRL